MQNMKGINSLYILEGGGGSENRMGEDGAQERRVCGNAKHVKKRISPVIRKRPAFYAKHVF